jgi:hypothetical protein
MQIGGSRSEAGPGQKVQDPIRKITDVKNRLGHGSSMRTPLEK